MNMPVNNRRRPELSELRKLLALGRALAWHAQQSGDEMLVALGAAWDNELMRIHAKSVAAAQPEPKPIEEQ